MVGSGEDGSEDLGAVDNTEVVLEIVVELLVLLVCTGVGLVEGAEVSAGNCQADEQTLIMQLSRQLSCR